MLLFPGISGIAQVLSLVVDLMFLNNIPFLITMSSGIKLVTVEYISSRTAKYLSKKLKIVI